MKYLQKLKKLLDINAYKALNKYTLGHKKAIAILTILNILNAFTSIAIAFISKQLVDSAIDSNKSLAITYAIIFALMLLLQLSLTSLISYNTVKIQETMRNKLQLNILERIYKKSWLSINKYKTGDLLTRVYNDVNNIVNASTVIVPNLITLVLQLIAAFSLLAYYDSLLATITFLVSPVTIIISMFIGRKLKKLQHLVQQADGVQRSMINESLQNQIILKTYNYLPSNLSIISSFQSDRFQLITKRNLLGIKAHLVLGLGYRFAFFGAMALGALRLSMKAITFGTFTAFIQLVAQIQVPIQGLTQSLPKLISSLSSVERLQEIESLENDYTSSQLHEGNLIPASINVDKLSFQYNEDNKIFNNTSLKISNGDKIAIIGSSGQGKTTFIHILLSLIKPDSGDLSIEFKDNTSVPLDSNTRKYFSYVPQSNTLFSGSIRDNFLITNNITDEDLEKALVTSCAKGFISSLENGLDTLISERGIGLSEGQAQRITIARALLHRTPFLVFDEATSALDMDTEKELIHNIKAFYPDTTLIAVTHRDSILTICDKVLKLKDGKFTLITHN